MRGGRNVRGRSSNFGVGKLAPGLREEEGWGGVEMGRGGEMRQ